VVEEFIKNFQAEFEYRRRDWLRNAIHLDPDALQSTPHANRQHAPTRATDAGADGPAMTQPLT